MAGGFNNPLVGGDGTLEYPAIKSPNYVPGSAGWSINQDGTVEFNNGVFRGTITAGVFQGTNFIINQAGAFFYTGTPALGNLFASIASSAVGGVDDFGNVYQGPGSFYYSGSGDGGYIGLSKTNTGQVIIYLGNTTHTGANASSLELTVDTLNIGWGGTGGSISLSQGTPGYCTVNSPIFAVDGSAANPTLIETDSWHNVSLVAGWTAGNDLNGTSFPPAYKLLPDGNVAIRGVLVTPGSGAIPGTAFTNVALPVAYRPSTWVVSASITNAAGGTSGHVSIRPNGNLCLEGAFGNSFTVKLDSILLVRLS